MPRRIKVLVVEDDAALRKVLELRLTLEGFEVAVAGDGQEGVEMLAATGPDAAISDLMMPRLDGHGFCRRARQLEGFEDLPIILLTAHQRDASVDRLLELGNIVFMPKPFDAPTLSSTLRQMVAARGADLSRDARTEARAS